MAEYDFRSIEDRWQKTWLLDRAWAAPERPRGTKRYVVTMYPYPSGDLHMGHVEIFTIHDTIARFYRMQGFDVLNPMGWDAFGLPAENAAIKRGVNPKKWTYDNIAKHRLSMERLGYSFDWDRTFNTCDPGYYKWNQWFFLRFYDRGLAYRRNAPANWCPNCKTVLANEQVIAGHCERCGTQVVKRYLTQWFFKITDYADRLLDDLDLNRGWNDRLRSLQRNWIGRSYGAEVDFDIEGRPEPVTVFTTRPDTLWGATFFVVAPEHPLAEELAAASGLEDELALFRQEVAALSDIDRSSTERPKKGLFLRKHATNPVNGEAIPIWVADYVLMEYGTGAIMAVPAHDQRDLDFARAYELPVRVVIQPRDTDPLDADSMTIAYDGDGVMINSDGFEGTATGESVRLVTEWLAEQGRGRAAKSFRIRDWLISRQRYWGTPIPILYCGSCGEVPVPEADLPVVLPDIVDYTPSGESSPLAKVDEWVNVECPQCGGAARRETDTMDTFVDSSWYFNRYLDPHNDELPFDPQIADAWMPIDQYSGGITHAVMHLIYARFFQKVLVDMGMSSNPEPYPALLNQGMVTMGGKAMSKTRGNIVEPVEAFDRYGSDALRLYMLFSGPPEQDFDWPLEGVTSIGRVTAPWLQRVWRLCEEVRSLPETDKSELGEPDITLRRAVHRTVKVVTRDYESFSFNTAISRLQELVNEAYRLRAQGGGHPEVLRELVEALLKMLAPMAPFITEEQWHRLGHDGSIHFAPWPVFDPGLAAEDEVIMVVQVNGKVRDTIAVPAEVTEDQMIELALASPNVQSYLGEQPPVKVIARPPKIVSLVATSS